MSVVLFHGSDESLVSEAVSERVRQLVGDDDRSLKVDDYSGDYVMAAAVEAAETPSFFTERRVVVVRAVGARPN